MSTDSPLDTAEQVIREARATVDAANRVRRCVICDEPNGHHSPGCQNAPSASPLDIQVAGDHYKSLAIQPAEYIHANGIGWFEGNVIKYVTRWRKKGGFKDLDKAKHFIDLLIELEGRKK